MNAIQRGSVIWISIMMLFTCCEVKEKCNLLIPSDISNDWKIDSTGCLRKRYDIMIDKRINFDGFIGHNIDCVVKNLGKWNEKRTYQDATEYDYYYTCCYVSPPDDMRYNFYVSRLIIDTDVKGKVLHFHAAIP